MIKRMTAVFLKGVLTLAPLLVSIYLLAWFLRNLEAFTNRILLWFLPDVLYIPGMGIALGVVLIFGLGLIMEIPLARYVHSKVEVPFTRAPLVKSIYFAIKDLAAFVVPGEGHRRGQAVTVQFPDSEMRVVGILTRDQEAGMPPGLKGRVAVYIPISYQIGGMTIFVPRAWLTEMAMPVEEVMRQVLTAWMPTSERH
jgi:uncharacterized membrane protein